MDYCTCSPDSILGIKIGDLCKKHDKVYAKGCCWTDKIIGDLDLGFFIMLRGLKHLAAGIALIILSPFYALLTLTVGGFIWRKRHGKR